jgi:L-threonylcarbamoyladenylate synthase
MDPLMKTEIQRCLEVLQSGGIILYPTDTIWGIGCDATNESAVAKIIALKQRADSKSMIVLIDQSGRLATYIKEVPQQAYELMELSEQPITLVLEGARGLAKNVIAEDGSAGVRMVLDEFCRNLIGRLRKPLVSTSANISGTDSPANYSEIADEIINGVDYVVQLRQHEMEKKKPSAIIRVGAGGQIKFIRK